MFTYLYDWIKNIAFYMVMVTAVIHMIPNSDYKKYIRFFTSLVLIIMLVTPVLNLFGMGKEIMNIYENGIYQDQIEKMEESTEYLENINWWGDSYHGEEKPEKKIEVEEIQIGQSSK